VASERQLHTETSGRLNEAIDQRDVVTDIYNNAPCGYHSLDREGRISQINNTELRWLGRSRDDVLGRPYSDFVSDASRSEFATRFAQFVAQGTINDVELELVRKDGTTLLVLLNATSIREGNAHLMSRSTVFDITERKKLEVQLDQLARSDPLTGLSNRRDFYEKAQHELAMARRFQTPLALLMLDIDHFKRVNDSHGHDGGDAVLQALSRILRQVLRETDITARFGGEEFVVLIPGTDGPGALEAAERLRTTVAETRVALPNSAVVQLTVSIGLATLQETDTTIDQLLKRADLGAYTAKRDGRNRVRAREHLAAG
jgi:diguanylate cyclase (GGDEF)-like protein/PAS domain S-box-containing protein